MSMDQRHRQQVGIILLFIFIATFTTAQIPATGSQAKSPVSDLQDKENQILAELITINQKIETMQKEKDALEKRLAANQQKAARAKADLDVVKADLQEQTRKLGQMVSFIYQFGYVSLLDVFLSAADFDDFTNRLFLISAIVDRYAQMRDQTEKLKNKTESKLQEINKINALIAADRKKILQSITLLQKTKNERSGFLAQIKRQSAGLAARITLSAECWSRANATITGALEKLSSLPPEEFMPDKISFKLGGLQVEFNENTLNSKMNRGDTLYKTPVHINIEPKQTVFSGFLVDTGTSFKVTGDFKTVKGGREILFVPRSFSFGETTIEGNLLSYIYQNNFLKWDITRNLPNYYVAGIATDSNKIEISFRLI
ncbi:coiled-coil domain-containing protein [Desulfotruncus alcoholivorax]|uniref:coiled-coil domain-containing protein n=1 Tax=Desulfotruncus alcoholivorax TaxID=265477 RepID=UPI00047F1B84|nr:hypothetical protein [Desulfotruncus alcoholivorax]